MMFDHYRLFMMAFRFVLHNDVTFPETLPRKHKYSAILPGRSHSLIRSPMPDRDTPPARHSAPSIVSWECKLCICTDVGTQDCEWGGTDGLCADVVALGEMKKGLRSCNNTANPSMWSEGTEEICELGASVPSSSEMPRVVSPFYKSRTG